MTRFILAAGAAALAIATPSLAEKGGHGGGHGGNKGAAQKANHGGGHGGGAKADHAKGGGKAMAKIEHGKGPSMKAERHGGPDRIKVAGNGHAKGADWRDDRRDDFRVAANGLIDGCPPGLAAKNNGCLPPGQAKKLLGSRLAPAYANSLIPSRYRDWYRDDPSYYYRASDGYMYRVNRGDGLISGLIPLFDTGYYPLGMSYPSQYDFYNVPAQYRSVYPDGRDYYYRYGPGAIYSVDPKTQLVSGIAALLAGDLAVGQPLPNYYNVYNVPVSYRDRYYDTPTSWYRYNDGYIYQVDPTTRLIQAVISALV